MFEDQNLFELLLTDKILRILDGDSAFGEYKFKDTGTKTLISMPYLKGKEICELATELGFPISYVGGSGSPSRQQYLRNVFEKSIQQDRCSDLLAYLFRKEQFLSKLSGHTEDAANEAYSYITKMILAKINDYLSLGKHELVSIRGRYVIKKTDKNNEIQTPQLDIVTSDYIKDVSIRAFRDINQQDFDSAITKSRTLLEETFIYVIEMKNVSASTSGDIGKLYTQVKDLYHMHGDANADRRINTLISGLEKIVSSISEMRNNYSDAHGVGEKRINIEEHHARLVVNSATAMAEFILSVAEKGNR